MGARRRRSRRFEGVVALSVGLTLGGCQGQHREGPNGGAGRSQPYGEEDIMQLGNFSVSLAVKDLQASRAFYEALGFRVIGGEASQNWLILQNDTATVGLFQGMFEQNILTFNPGWDRSSNTLPAFDDVRAIQRHLEARGITPVQSADPAGTGPASFVIVDPDGNLILVDQHVPKPVD